MSFRKEKKFILDPNNLIFFYQWIKKNRCEQLYKNRKINSIYYDNKNFQMYHDSNEGVLPRKKIRLRFYNNENDSLLLEKKISSLEGRFKNSREIQKDERIKEVGIFDKNYGLCNPVLKVSYFREYYVFEKYRITFDKNICYSKIYSENTVKDNYNVIEFKGVNFNEDNLSFSFPYLESRFSKYCRAYEFLLGQKL